MGRGADHDRSRLGGPLETSGDVRRPPDRQVLGLLSLTELAGNREAGVDADADLEPEGLLHRKLGPELLDVAGELETSLHGATRLALVGGGIAEVGQHAVAVELGDVSGVPNDDVRDGGVVAAERLAQVLRIQPLRELSRVDEVAEQHGHVAPLGTLVR